MTQPVPASVSFTWPYPPCISLLSLLQSHVPKEVVLFVGEAGGGFVEIPGTTAGMRLSQLKALIVADESFSHLSKKTMVLRFVAHSGKGVPTPEAEKQDGNVLELTDPTQTLEEAITELQGKVPGADVSKLFIVASVPPPPKTREERLAAATTVDEVYANLADGARAAVDAARAHRKRITEIPALKELEQVMSAARARELGITVLREVDERMVVGMFDLPPLDPHIVEPPKSESR